jgi:hypothetical protein
MQDVSSWHTTSKVNDSYFILQYLHGNGVIPEVITRGAKVLTLSVPMFNIKFIDSLSFIPMKLADFPNTFGLDELAKGYFPHLINRKENENYVAPLPPSPFYNPDGMSPEEKEKFMAWHKKLKEENYMFDFQQEILGYCFNCEILGLMWISFAAVALNFVKCFVILQVLTRLRNV